MVLIANRHVTRRDSAPREEREYLALRLLIARSATTMTNAFRVMEPAEEQLARVMKIARELVLWGLVPLNLIAPA
jgi:hypothetical protein